MIQGYPLTPRQSPRLSQQLGLLLMGRPEVRSSPGGGEGPNRNIYTLPGVGVPLIRGGEGLVEGPLDPNGPGSWVDLAAQEGTVTLRLAEGAPGRAPKTLEGVLLVHGSAGAGAEGKASL